MCYLLSEYGVYYYYYYNYYYYTTTLYYYYYYYYYESIVDTYWSDTVFVLVGDRVWWGGLCPCRHSDATTKS